jgi:receptor expression-enhancing protein 5/6
VPKVYAILGLGGLYFFLVFFNIAGGFLVNIAGFMIPGYYSLNALFSASKVDDTQVRAFCHPATTSQASVS